MPLTVGRADDPAERHADRVAADVIARLTAHVPDDHQAAHQPDRSPGPDGPAVRRHPGSASPGVIGAAGGPIPDDVAEQITRATGSGRPLDTAVRRTMEPAFGRNLGGVRVHDDPQAGQLASLMSARAFTAGRNIFFGAGEYRPHSPEGQHVLAHELAHATQDSSVRRMTVHRKLRGTADAVENLGGGPTSGRARKLVRKLTNWDKILRGLREYEATEAWLVAGGANPGVSTFLKTKPKMQRTLQKVTKDVAEWKQDNQHEQNENYANTSRAKAAKDSDQKLAQDQRTKAGRRQAIALLEPRIGNEVGLLASSDTNAWISSLGLSTSQVTNRGQKDAGQKNQVQELAYQTEVGKFTGYFKQDIGFNPSPEKHELTTGIRQHDPNYGARAVAMYRLDQLLGAGVTARAEFAVHQDDNGRSVLGTVLETAKGQKVSDLKFGMDAEHAKSLGPQGVALDDPVLQRGLNKLQILDAIAGQLDRHQGNYRIQTDNKGKVLGVTGIDLDMAFGNQMTAPDHKSANTAHNYRGLPESIDAEMGRAILRIKDSDIQAALTGLLPKPEVAATVKRFQAVQKAVQEADKAGMLREDWDSKSAAQHLTSNQTSFMSSRKSYMDDTAVTAYVELGQQFEDQIRTILSGRSHGHRIRSANLQNLVDLPAEIVKAMGDAYADRQAGFVTTKVAAYVFDNHVPGSEIPQLLDMAMDQALDLALVDKAIVACQTATPGQMKEIFKSQVGEPFKAAFPGIVRKLAQQNAGNRRRGAQFARGR
jgi:hypothetical protein